MDASTWIALGSLLLVALLGLSQLRLQRRVTNLETERRDEELRDRRLAMISIDTQIEENPLGGARFPHTYLVVKNDGPAVARMVDFNAQDFAGNLAVSDQELPVPLLQPGQRVRFFLATFADTLNTYVTTVQWEDDSGRRSEQFYVKPY